MDPISQGTVGAAFAQSSASKNNIIRIGFIGFLAGLAPDLDVLIRSSDDPILFLEYHRQFSHSLFFIPFGSLFVALFKLIPSEYLSENEIEAAELAYPQIGSKRLFNPQQQIPMTWPANPSVALSYVDQLERIGAIETDTKEDIRSLLSSFDDEISKGGNNRLSRKIRNISINKDTESDNAQRIQSLLKANLDGISEKLRRR
tara:strand:- start:3500 stop:4105 length:606 start_codon:yes stop_codon:yes gene_type:complete